MANFQSLTVYGENSNASESVAFPTSGAGGWYVRQVLTPFTQAGVSIVSQIVIPSSGLNLPNKIYNSTQTVAQIVTAIGATYVTISLYRSTQSTAATNIALPVQGHRGNIISAVSNITIAGVAMLSKITLPAHSLRKEPVEFYSASSVSTVAALFG